MSSRKPRIAPPAGPAAGRRAALAALAVVVAAALAWRLRPERQPRRAGPDVLLITVDTLRADAVGGAASATPWIDRLAAGGVRFEDARAHNVVTLPSHANILSGRYPLDHGVRDNAGYRFPAGMDTLATLLQARGYRTGAFVSAFPLDSRFGLARGFDRYDDGFTETARPALLERERPGPETVARARRWLDEGTGPAFCWVHLYEPHYPYEPGEPWASRFPADPYRGEVAAADDALRPLLEPLLHAGPAGRTLVVLTSDHGEALGDHGEATHGIFAYEATLRVPLLFFQPGALRPSVVVGGPARHVDILPTVLDALGLPVPEGLAGRSLLPLAAGSPAPPGVPTYFEALSGQLNRGWAPLRGVVQDRTKYIDLPLPELYDLAADPREARDLSGAEPGRLEALRAVLARLRAADRGAARRPEDAEARERLGSLGYLSGRGAAAPGPSGEADDPKRLIALDARLQEVVGAYLAGDLPEALRRCRELVRIRPAMAISLLYLAHLQREAGALADAAETLRRAVALAPEDATAVALLGATLTQAGRAPEAAAALEPLALRDPPDLEVASAYGLALARLGRHREAVAALERARLADPSSAALLVHLGTVRLMAGEREPARRAFEAALAQNPGLARAHSSLGALAGEEGRPDAGAAHWREAIAIDPRESGTLLALGLQLRRSGRAAEARRALELFVALAPASRAQDVERVRRLLAEGPP